MGLLQHIRLHSCAGEPGDPGDVTGDLGGGDLPGLELHAGELGMGDIGWELPSLFGPSPVPPLQGQGRQSGC